MPKIGHFRFFGHFLTIFGHHSELNYLKSKGIGVINGSKQPFMKIYSLMQKFNDFNFFAGKKCCFCGNGMNDFSFFFTPLAGC